MHKMFPLMRLQTLCLLVRTDRPLSQIERALSVAPPEGMLLACSGTESPRPRATCATPIAWR